MARRFTGTQLLIASHNRGKIGEIAALLAPYKLHISSLADHDAPAPEETGATCRDNAVLKARAAVTAIGLPALADDSGLEVFALDGWPGVHTAEIGGPERDHELSMKRILARLGTNPDRRARMVCVLALAWPDGHVETVEGEVRGQLVYPARGLNGPWGGWGYDPYFLPEGHDKVFAQMPRDAKNALSHRANALRALIHACF
jgi:XTP/dITP diphosphohydrolase